MIEIKTIGVAGFEGAVRGMRNPYESHEKSDSGICEKGWNCTPECYQHYEKSEDECVAYRIGPADMTLCKKLIKAGSEHRKFLRMIHVQADVVAPRYWWAEMDKYKYVEANSSSTMHLITKRELTVDDFSADGYARFDLEQTIIPIINKHIRNYREGIIDKEMAFRAIKQLLPESFNQLRTIDTNYETLLSIHQQRKNHRLSEWHTFCEWVEGLPYMSTFIKALDKN